MLSFTFPNVICLQWHSMFDDTAATMTNEQYGGVHWIVNHLSVICNFTQAACMYRCCAPWALLFWFHFTSFFCSFLFLIFNVSAPGAHSNACCGQIAHRTFYYNKFEYCVVIGRDFDVSECRMIFIEFRVRETRAKAREGEMDAYYIFFFFQFFWKLGTVWLTCS